MSLLVRILLILSTYVVLMRLLRPFFKRVASRRRPEAATSAAVMVRDPMCGMYLDPRLGFRLDHKREALYFCSEECRRKFVEAPPAETRA